MNLKDIFYDWGGFNVWLFHLINGVHSPVWDQLMQWGSQLGEAGNFVAYLVVLVVAGLWFCRKGQNRALAPWLAVIAVFALGYVAEGLLISLLKSWFHYPRPPLALAGESPYVYDLASLSLHHSLPSGHAAFTALCAASLWPLLGGKGRVAAALFVLWVACSRISLGAHFPADVFYGVLLSLILVWLLRWPVNGALGLK